MKKIKLQILAFFLISISFISNVKGQDSLQLTPNSNDTLLKTPELTTHSQAIQEQQFNFQYRSFENKFWRGMGYSLIYNITMGLYLISLPDEITQWHAVDKFKIPHMLNQYKNSFTTAPVIDQDLWYVNYLGHPYQGSFYYNSIRAQGGTILQSSLYNLFQSTIWEYIWEGGLEQPSINDMIVTPLLGSLLGELTHHATLSMRKNGFKWYEKAFVIVFNPAYAINNGFKENKRRK